MSQSKKQPVSFTEGFYDNLPNMFLDLHKHLEVTSGTDYHYSAETIQTTDVWDSLGTLNSTARDTAIKYLMRYGKKEGKNKKDLLKAIHYIMMVLYNDHYR